MTQAPLASQATDTRVAILTSALACFRSYGLRKTTIVDIVRAPDDPRPSLVQQPAHARRQTLALTTWPDPAPAVTFEARVVLESVKRS